MDKSTEITGILRKKKKIWVPIMLIHYLIDGVTSIGAAFLGEHNELGAFLLFSLLGNEE